MASSTRFDTSVKQHPLPTQSASQHAHPQNAYAAPRQTQAQVYPGARATAVKTQFAEVKHTNSSEGVAVRPELPTPATSRVLNPFAAFTQQQLRAEQQNAYASQLFQSSSEECAEEQDEFGGSDAYALEEEGGDSDFEPADQAAYNQQVKHPEQLGGLSDLYELDPSSVLVGSQYTAEEASHLLLHHGSGVPYSQSDDIAFKLAGEHELYPASARQSMADHANMVLRMRKENSGQQKRSSLGRQQQSHYDTTNFYPGASRKYSDNSSSSSCSLTNSPKQISRQGMGEHTAQPSMIKNKPAHKTVHHQESRYVDEPGGQGAGSVYARQMIDHRDDKLPSSQYNRNQALYETSQNSSNVRRFTRNISAYQSSFGKPHTQTQRNEPAADQRSVDSDFLPPRQKKAAQQYDSSYTSEENEVLLDSDFKSQKNYYNSSARPTDLSRDIEMQDLSGHKDKAKYPSYTTSGVDFYVVKGDAKQSVQNQKQAAGNLAKIKEQNYIQDQGNTHHWVDDYSEDGDNSESVTQKFKSTAVGFSPLTKLASANSSGKKDAQNHVQQPGDPALKNMTSFGWSSNTEKFSGSVKDLKSTSDIYKAVDIQNMSHYEKAQQLGQYAMLYPQKQISPEAWEAQNRNMQGTSTTAPSTTQKEKRKKKSKDTNQESHFMLQGQLASYLESRTYFRNSEESLGKTKKQVQQSSTVPDSNSKEALFEWFESLSVQDRVNSLTTTYPILVGSLIDAQLKWHKNGPLCLIAIRSQKGMDQAQNEMAQGRGGRNRQGQPQEHEFIFEKCADEVQFMKNSFSMGDTNQAMTREFQTKIIKMTRITTNKVQYDTLTVTNELVKDARTFFSLMENITDGHAFSQPLLYVTRHGGGGKPIIQTPKWFDCKKSHYLGQWITTILEETLWAHFNYARQINISAGVRKNDLNGLFELRQENLHDQNDLANRWAELQEEGQQKLINQLSLIAKEEQPQKFYNRLDEQDRRYQQYYGHGDDLQIFTRPQPIGLYYQTQADIPIMRHDTYKQANELESVYSYRASHVFSDQQGHMFGSGLGSSARNSLGFIHNDIDLREIYDILSYLQPLDLIKYLSEIPLTEVNQRKHARKHHLCLKLHEMIQDNLRQHIQDQLINEPLFSDAPFQKGSSTQATDNDEKKGKSKKSKEVRKNKKRGGQQQQVQTPQQYQKKKQSISPPRQSHQQQLQEEPKPVEPQPANKPSAPAVSVAVETVEAVRVASTTTSDDQHQQQPSEPAQKVTPQKAPSIQTSAKAQQQQQQRKPANSSQKKAALKVEPPVDDAIIKAHVKKLLDDVVERVCKMDPPPKQPQSEKEPPKRSQTQDVQKPKPQPAVKEERAEPASKPVAPAPKPQHQPQSTAQNQEGKKRRRPQKKKQDDQEKLNSFMRKYCGEADETETHKDNKQRNQKGQPQKSNQQSQQSKSQSSGGSLASQRQPAQTSGKDSGKQKPTNLQQQPAQQQQQQYQNKGKPREEPAKASSSHQHTKKRSKDDESLEEPKPLIIPQAKEPEEKVLQPPSVEEVKNDPVVRRRGGTKMLETQTMFVFNIDSQPHLVAEHLRKQQAQEEKAMTADEGMSSHSQPLVQSSEMTQPSSASVEESDREQQTQSAVQVEITIQQDSPRDTKSDGEPQREKISLTEHFSQAQNFNLTSFSGLKDELYPSASSLYDNSGIKLVGDYPQQQQNQGFFQITQDDQPKWSAAQFSAPADIQPKMAQNLSTTSVSFTPSSLQVSQQQSLVSDDHHSALEMTPAQPQQPDSSQGMFSGFPPQQMTKYNSMNMSPPLIQNNFFPEPQQYQQKSSPPHLANQHQHFGPTNHMGVHTSGFQQQFGGLPRGGSGEYIQKGSGAPFKKSSAPFRQQTASYQQQLFMQPQYGQKDMLNDFGGYNNSYPQQRSAGRGQQIYKKQGGDFLTNMAMEQPSFGQPLSSFSASIDHNSSGQIRLDAPSFDPMAFQGGSGFKSSPELVQKPQFELRKWNYYQGGQIDPKSLGGYEMQTIAQNNHHPLYMQLEDQFYREFDKNIELETKRIKQVIAQFEPEREYILKKLQAMADEVFQGRNAEIKVFGSLMTGLALETSDMDLAVTGLKIDGREDMIDDLLSLGCQVQKWALIKDYKAIETASIPVIKANVSLYEVQKEMGRKEDFTSPEHNLPIDITFDDSPADTTLLMQNPALYHQNLNAKNSYGGLQDFQGQNPQIQKVVSNDPMTHFKNLITGELGLQLAPDPMANFGMDFGGQTPHKTHLGLASCTVLKEYVRTYPHLRDVAILLKRFLAEHDINHPYLGGISSYSAVLLIVAYMNHFKLHQSPYLTPSRLMMGFLDFYSNCFDPKHYGVDTTQGMSFYPLPRVNQQTFVIVDPVNPANNTARNSFRTQDVLNHFRAAFFSLKSQIASEFQAQLAAMEKPDRKPASEGDWPEAGRSNQSPRPQSKGERAEGDGSGQRSKQGGAGKKGNASSAQVEPPVVAKASEQKKPSSNQPGVPITSHSQAKGAAGAGASQAHLAPKAFSMNMVSFMLSSEIFRKSETEKADSASAQSGFGGSAF